MEKLKKKIKSIIFRNGGLPGLDQAEYLHKMTKILDRELSTKDKDLLSKNGVAIKSLIAELSTEIAEEIL